MSLFFRFELVSRERLLSSESVAPADAVTKAPQPEGDTARTVYVSKLPVDIDDGRLRTLFTPVSALHLS
jgi:hypothetical protein